MVKGLDFAFTLCCRLTCNDLLNTVCLLEIYFQASSLPIFQFIQLGLLYQAYKAEGCYASKADFIALAFGLLSQMTILSSLVAFWLQSKHSPSFLHTPK